MNTITVSYTLYLAISLALTVWVARTLHRNGRVFLIEAFHGRTDMADAVNHLLVVGFYLVNLGFITMALRAGAPPTNTEDMFVYLSTKIGVATLVLGGMHFNFDRMRRKGRRSEALTNAAPPPLPAR